MKDMSAEDDAPQSVAEVVSGSTSGNNLDELLAQLVSLHGREAVAKSLEQADLAARTQQLKHSATSNFTEETESVSVSLNDANDADSSSIDDNEDDVLRGKSSQNRCNDSCDQPTKVEDENIGWAIQKRGVRRRCPGAGVSFRETANKRDVFVSSVRASTSTVINGVPRRLSNDSMYSLGSEDVTIPTDIRSVNTASNNKQVEMMGMSMTSMSLAASALSNESVPPSALSSSGSLSRPGMSRCMSMATMDTHSKTASFNASASMIAAKALRRQSTKLRQAEKQKEAMMNAAFDPEFTCDVHGTVLIANKAANQMFGFDLEMLALGHVHITSLLSDRDESKRKSDVEEEKRLWTYLTDHAEERIELNGFHSTTPNKVFPVEVVLSKVVPEEEDKFDSFLSGGINMDGEEEVAGVDAADKSTQFVVVVHDLTKRRRNELNESIQRGILKASFDPIFTLRKDGKIIMANDAAKKEYGYESFKGRNFASLIVATDEDDDEDDIWYELLEGLGRRVEVDSRRANRTIIPIELAMEKIADGDHIVAFVHSLERRRKNEEEKTRKQNMINGIMNASFDPQITFEQSGRIILLNTAAEEAFGWSQSDITSKNIDIDAIFAMASEDDDGVLETSLEASFEGQRCELTALQRNGRTFPAEVCVREIKTGQAYGLSNRTFVMFARDLTIQKLQATKLIQKQALNDGIVESNFDALLAFKEDGTIQRANKAASTIFGMPRIDLVGKNISSLLLEDDGADGDYHYPYSNVSWIRDLAGCQKEVIGINGDGQYIPVMLGVSCIHSFDNMSPEDRKWAKELCHPWVATVRDLSLEKKHQEMEIEKAKSDALLLNMLPEHLAVRLKEESPSHIADRHEGCTMLFADIVGFTEMSALLDPTELVAIINGLFSKFDDLVEEHGLNKVKTIGDCYFASSIPGDPNHSESCRQVCLFALDMMDSLAEFNNSNHNRFHLKLRVGINTGPVVAGVVGRKRYLFDLWGDAVNLASRMESTGIPNMIQTTQTTVDLLKGNDEGLMYYSRGKIEVKGKGLVQTYFLNRDEVVTELPTEVKTNIRPRIIKEASERRVSCLDF